MQSLEQKGFLATEEDVAKLTNSVLNAVQEAESGRKTYLKCLIASTQSELGGKPRIRTAPKIGKLDEEARYEQLNALNAVHEKFYIVVVKVAADSVPPTMKDRAVEVNRRSNFARTALYALRTWVRAGNDITSLGVHTASKASLEVERQALKPPAVKTLKRRAERESKSLVKTLLTLADEDKAAAIEEIKITMGQLSDQLLAFGVETTKDAATSHAEFRPFRMGKNLFMPTHTQVLAKDHAIDASARKH